MYSLIEIIYINHIIYTNFNKIITNWDNFLNTNNLITYIIVFIYSLILQYGKNYITILY